MSPNAKKVLRELQAALDGKFELIPSTYLPGRKGGSLFGYESWEVQARHLGGVFTFYGKSSLNEICNAKGMRICIGRNKSVSAIYDPDKAPHPLLSGPDFIEHLFSSENPVSLKPSQKDNRFRASQNDTPEGDEDTSNRADQGA